MLRIKKIYALAAALAYLSLPAFSLASEKNSPDPVLLMSMVFNNPPQAYHGQMVVSYWSETESRAEDVQVYFAPPNKYRFEFLAPNGTVERIVLSNGAREEVQLLENNRVNETYTTDRSLSLITPQDEKNLLLTNYKATLKEPEKIIGRLTWTVELTPLVPGKPHQLMRIDQKTKVILEIKRYMPEGKTGFVTRFVQFEPGSKLGSDSFLSDVVLDPTTKKDSSGFPQDGAPNVLVLPDKLYGGFSLEGGDQFEVSGKSVMHCWYSDGLLPVSVFHTPLPVKAPEQGEKIIEWSRPLRMGSTRAGSIYQWEKDKEYYTLIGDMQPDLLQEIAGHIK